MKYATYWSILDSPSHTIKSNFIALIIFLSAGLLWVLVKKMKRDKDNGDKAILLWGTGAFAFLGLLLFFLLTFIYKDNSDAETLKMLNSPSVAMVEGVISNFHRTYRNGREIIESFTVDSVQFAYGDALLGRFNSFTKTNNNVIYNGQAVRITYKRNSPYGNNFNSILKPEIGL